MPTKYLTSRNLLLFFFVFALLFSFYIFCTNKDVPVVRSSLFYGNMALQFIDTGFDTSKINYFDNHPQGMILPFLSIPFLTFTNINVALKIASYLFSCFFILLSFFFFRRFNERFEIDVKWIPLELLFVFFNPLMLHQFYAATPDSAFASWFILGILLIDNILIDYKREVSIFSLFGLFLISFLTKPVSFVIFLYSGSFLAYLFFFRRNEFLPKKAIQALFAAAALMIIVAFLMQKKYLGVFFINLGALFYPSKIITEKIPYYIAKDFFVFFETLFLTFNLFFIPFLLGLPSLLKKKWKITSFLPIYTSLVYGAILLYHCNYTSYTIRFFIPLFPILSLLTVRGIVLSKKDWKILLIPYLIFNTFFILAYAHTDMEQKIKKNWPIFLRAHDSFFLQYSNEMKNEIHLINASLPEKADLFILDSYIASNGVAAGHYLYDRAGLIREDIKTTYALSVLDFKLPKNRSFYIWEKYRAVQERHKELKAKLSRYKHKKLDSPYLYKVTPA